VLPEFMRQRLFSALAATRGAIMQSAESQPTSVSPFSPALIEPLSERELEVLKLVSQGLSNSDIAHTLIVTVGTVKKHLNNIFGKLHVSSRTQAIGRGRELGLLRP